MTTTINALSSKSIRHAEFVKLTTATTVYTFCNAAAPITVSGTTYSNLSALLMLSDVKRDIKNTSSDMVITLTGIDPANIALILSTGLKGATIETYRGFLDSNNQIITTPSQQFFKRYQGIVSNMSVTEDFNSELRTRVATCSVSCASFRSILEKRMGGVKTNATIWKSYYPGDTSMDRVAAISATYFDFGKAPIAATVAAPATAPDQNQPSYDGWVY